MDQFTQPSTSFSADKMIDSADQVKLAEFVGEKKREFYFRKWQKDNSWNWAAFFLPLFWLGYRKMLKPVVYILLGFIAIDIIVLFMSIDGAAISRGLGYGLAGALGITGNMFYRKHAEKQVQEVNQLSISEEEKMHELRKRGGTSGKGAFLAVLMFVGYILITLGMTLTLA
ncbi:DUF2628 domain-containing protein [Fictibacillus sp. 18YEL24]|uniref:DUF2628 domain-containing protein n=1 Tax=Fictibacillus sp. 18YEL24 TaxID=2745875 RepID=UPI0018CF9167|nr:DUF2628 domain-containing protein [Fictibacillus sp. 18YEL24]MBH0169132.1 DUF2628 domain-containing protein [Fictibacillus sp. 18YEL24]